jgi:hypothetical protein
MESASGKGAQTPPAGPAWPNGVVGLALEADDDIVGVAHDDHVAYGFAPRLPPLAAGRSSDPFQMCIAGEALPPSISD